MGIGCINSRILSCGLSGNALLVFLGLLAHMDKEGRCFPSIHRLSESLGIRRNTITKAVKELEKARILRVSRRLRAKSIYQLRSMLSWNLAQIEPQIDSKSGSNKAPAKLESGSNGLLEVESTFIEPRTTKRINDGAMMEDDFWRFFASIPFNGRACNDVRLIPADVKRSSNAAQLLSNAWSMNPWFKTSCEAIYEWYSWPWRASGQEKRKSSVRGLIHNFSEQADLAGIAISERARFSVVEKEIDDVR